MYVCTWPHARKPLQSLLSYVLTRRSDLSSIFMYVRARLSMQVESDVFLGEEKQKNTCPTPNYILQPQPCGIHVTQHTEPPLPPLSLSFSRHTKKQDNRGYVPLVSSPWNRRRLASSWSRRHPPQTPVRQKFAHPQALRCKQERGATHA